MTLEQFIKLLGNEEILQLYEYHPAYSYLCETMSSSEKGVKPYLHMNVVVFSSQYRCVNEVYESYIFVLLEEPE